MSNTIDNGHLAIGTPEREAQEQYLDRPLTDEKIMWDAIRSVIESGGYKLALDMIADPTTELGELFQLVMDGVADADIGMRLRDKVYRLARQKAVL